MTLRLKHLARISKGRATAGSANSDQLGVPLVNMNALRNTNCLEWIEAAAIDCEIGDILVCWDGSNAGEFFRSQHKGALASTIGAIKVSLRLDSAFTFYVLKANEGLIRRNSVGMGIPHVNPEELRNIPLPDISVENQRQIADFLDRETARIDMLIEKKQRFIEVLKSKLDGKIYEIITSGVLNHKIDESVDLIWQKGIPVSWQARKVRHLFRLVANPAPQNNDFELLSVYTAIGVRPRKDLEERGNKASTTDGYWRVHKGDIIVNKLLAWMGAIGVSEYSGVTSPAYDILRPIQKLEPFYYHYLFRIPRFSSELKRHSRGIMEMRLRLYFESFGRILVPVPPADEQRAIVAALRREEEEHDILSAKTVQSIDRLKEYRSALITAAVMGQIDVRTYAKSGTADRDLDTIEEEAGA